MQSRSVSDEKKDGFKFQIQGKRPPSSGLVQLGHVKGAGPGILVAVAELDVGPLNQAKMIEFK